MSPVDVLDMVKTLNRRLSAVEQILPTLATKEDLKAFATKEDLKAFATKEDLKAFATKEDLHHTRMDTQSRVVCAKPEPTRLGRWRVLHADRQRHGGSHARISI